MECSEEQKKDLKRDDATVVAETLYANLNIRLATFIELINGVKLKRTLKFGKHRETINRLFPKRSHTVENLNP